jgi:hypothetical protein
MRLCRERINYLLPTDLDSFEKWATVYETQEGGAVVCMDFDNHLETLAIANEKMLEQGIVAEMDINFQENAFVLVDQDNRQISFDIVMKAFFD